MDLPDGQQPPRADQTEDASPIVVAGFGMVAHRFVEALLDRAVPRPIVVIGEEPHFAYDRVHLSALFDGGTAQSLALARDDRWDGVELHLGRRAMSVDVERKVVVDDAGHEHAYGDLVLATGSSPFVPPIAGADTPGVFVYRTVDDVDAMGEWAAGCRSGVVVGGGLLGLEAANALRLAGCEVHVVDLAPRLMSAQLDEGGAAVLAAKVHELGVQTHLGVAPVEVVADEHGSCRAIVLADGSVVEAGIVVVAAGIRPRDELARAAGLVMGERGGVVIDDRCHTSARGVWAIGEVACHAGRVYGLVGPGQRMAEVVAATLSGQIDAFTGASPSVTLKLLGVDVVTVGNPLAPVEGSRDVRFDDPISQVYRRLVADAEGRLVGAVLVGDGRGSAQLGALLGRELPTGAELAALVAPAAGGVAPAGLLALPDDAPICSCNAVTKGALDAAFDAGSCDVAAMKACTRAGTSCGSCVPLLQQFVNERQKAAGVEVRAALCEHFSQTRAELFDIVRVKGYRTFAHLIGAHGRGLGCEICKPAVASMLASLANGYILDGEQASLQDTNDHVLANLQRDGTYSVVPRVPAGEITPLQLITIGEVARDFDLYTKITGGQRIDLFGARIDELPLIWRRLVDAGFESGHAYGKALRTVKSCVGTTWCRYGQQDSVGFAIAVEQRYKGLRAPHKLKMAVSGCARECAEAQSKDVGFIATEKGYDVYVCGNGGMRPRHAELLATGLSETEALRAVDRFLAYYIRTADRLQRTAPWFEQRFGADGIAELRAVVLDDSLGICAELDAMIEAHVANYRCEWADTLADPVRLSHFTQFVNDPRPDPSLAFERERGQRIPVRARAETPS